MADPALAEATVPHSPAPPPAPPAAGPPAVPRTASSVPEAHYGGFARWLLERLFGAVNFPAESVEPLQKLAQRATLVYVLRASSLQHLLYFNFTFWKLGLPIARAATGLGMRIYAFFARWYMGGKQVRAPRGAKERDTTAVVEAVRQGESVMVFLRQPRALSISVSHLSDPFPKLVELQRAFCAAQAAGQPLPAPRPIVIVPLTFLWRRRPRQLTRNWRDVLFGNPEEPTALRAFIGFLLHRSSAVVKVGTPVELATELTDGPGRLTERRDEEGTGDERQGPGDSDPMLSAAGQSDPLLGRAPSAAAAEATSPDTRMARRIRGFLHQHLARESRVVTGPPLKDAQRVVDLTLRDMTLRRTLAEIARERGRADDSVLREARRCLREIAARYNGFAVDVLKLILNGIFTRIYSGVDVDERGIQLLKETSAKGPLILCPCHKSHIDYLILSYVFDEHGIQPPHVAAGDNLNFWPVGRLLRMGGAFFIRRTFKNDKVYGATLSAYVKQLLRDGFTQEFFPEGGRSRTGKLLPPKFGMLSMEVDAWLTGVKSDAWFCPISISYEKLVEGASYQHELLGGEKKKEDAKALLGATKVLRSRYGRITIRFDSPVSLRQIFEERKVDPRAHSPEDRRKLVAALGWRVAAGINRAAPLAPMGLVSAALLSHDRRGVSQDEVLALAEFLHTAALDNGAHAPAWQTGKSEAGASTPPTLRSSGLVQEALETLRESGDVRAQVAGGETFWSVPEERRFALDYHKNGIIHFLVAPAILATALRSFHGQQAPLQELLRRAKELSRLFKNEFIYEPGRPFEVIVHDAQALLLRWGLVEMRGAPGEELMVPSIQGGRWLILLTELLRPFGEGVWICAESLELLAEQPLDAKEWGRRALDRGRAAWLAGRVRRSEALSKALLDNALAVYKERGVVVQGDGKGGKLSLQASWASAEKLASLTEEVDLFFG